MIQTLNSNHSMICFNNQCFIILNFKVIKRIQKTIQVYKIEIALSTPIFKLTLVKTPAFNQFFENYLTFRKINHFSINLCLYKN